MAVMPEKPEIQHHRLGLFFNLEKMSKKKWKTDINIHTNTCTSWHTLALQDLYGNEKIVVVRMGEHERINKIIFFGLMKLKINWK